MSGAAPKGERIHFRWEVTYVDLNTLLFIFFLMLYAQEFSGRTPGQAQIATKALAAVEKAFGGGMSPEAKARAEVREKEAALAGRLQAGIGSRGRVIVTPYRITVSLPADGLFAPGAAEPTHEAASLFADLARQIAEIPEDRIVLEAAAAGPPARPGPGRRDGLDLAAFRAIRVLEIFSAAPGLGPGRLIPAGRRARAPKPGLPPAPDSLDIHLVRH